MVTFLVQRGLGQKPPHFLSMEYMLYIDRYSLECGFHFFCNNIGHDGNNIPLTVQKPELWGFSALENEGYKHTGLDQARL